jgi:AraC-like DNA-binding protein
MPTSIEVAVERVIDTMKENLAEELTIDDMARAAMFSKFHFSRAFQRVTGISPGRFLSAIRIEEAKRLLVTTDLNVADISLRVGYSSVGTFSTRFTRSVGLSPTTYRRLGGTRSHIPAEAPEPAPEHSATIQGQVHPARPGEDPGLIFLGLFPQRIPEGRPVRCAILSGMGSFRFTDIPEGEWYLLCHSVSGHPGEMRQDEVAVATVGPIRADARVSTTASVHLKPVSKLDPPVLMALLDTRRAAFARMASAA